MDSGGFIARFYGGRQTLGQFCIASFANGRGDAMPQQRYTRSIAAINGFTTQYDQPGRACYHGVNTVLRNQPRKRSNIQEYCAAFVDGDFKGISEPPDVFLQTMRDLACPPTVIVASGHGYNPYWFFCVAIPASPEMETRYVAVLKGLCRILAGDTQACETARVMRLPGTHNSKYDGEFIEATVVHESERCYTLDELERFVASASELLHRPEPEPKPDNIIAARFKAYARRMRQLPLDVERLLEEMRFSGGESGIHKTQLKVSASLLNQGKDPQEVAELLLERTRFVHDRDCPRDQWDWDAEWDDIWKIIESWQARLKVEEQERQQQQTQTLPLPDEAPSKMNGSKYRFYNYWVQLLAPELPYGLLPPAFNEYAFKVAKQMGTDPAGLAFSALCFAAAVIPDWIRLQVKATNKYWREPARGWFAPIGDVSTRKTAMTNQSVRPLKKLEDQLDAKWRQAHKEWESIEDKQERKATPEPQLKAIRLEDVTVESAQEAFRDNVDGLLLFRDELAGWFGLMEKYGRSGRADHGYWLQSFDGGAYTWRRIGRGYGRVPNIGVSLWGGIQPDEIAAVIREGGNNGLVQRIVPLLLRSATFDNDDEPMDAAIDEYERIIHALFHKNWDRMCHTLHYDPEAQDIQLNLNDWVIRVNNNPLLSKQMKGHIGKYPAIFARLCLIFHCVENVDRPLPLRVTYDTARRVAELMRYLYQHAHLFYSSLNDEVNNIDVLQQFAGWILRNPEQKEVNARTLMRHAKRANRLDARGVKNVFDHLVYHHWLIPIEEAKKRVNSLDRYLINVDLQQDEELQKQRRELEWGVEEDRRIMQMQFNKSRAKKTCDT